MTTQYAEASYQEVIDLHTEDGKVSVLGIHTPVGDAPYTFLQGFFDMFQRYRYVGCSASLIPAARLPADISQVAVEGGDIPIDPRDLLNPILWHGAHGESLGSIMNQFYAGTPQTTDVNRQFFESGEFNQVSLTQVSNQVIWDSLYYRALTDTTWKKAHPQQGFRIRGLHPMVYGLGTNIQYVNSPQGSLQPSVAHRSNAAQDPDENTRNYGIGTAGSIGTGTGAGLSALPPQGMQTTNTETGEVSIAGQRYDNQFFSERLHNLGWLDTRVRYLSGSSTQTVTTTGDPYDDALALETLYEQVEGVEKINYLPKLFMGVCLLPPAYKAEQYYRLVLNHRFAFKKFRGLSMRGERVGRFGPGNAPSYNNLY